jgi:hypothetical protein
MGTEPENIDVDRVVQDINASVADVLTRSLGPYIRMASESTAQCSAVSQVLRKLPEFQELLEEKLQLAAEVSELRARLAAAESSGIRLRVSELPSNSQFVPAGSPIPDLTECLYQANTRSRAVSPFRDSLSEDESEEGSSDGEPTAESEMSGGMEELLNETRRATDSPYSDGTSDEHEEEVDPCPSPASHDERKTMTDKETDSDMEEAGLEEGEDEVTPSFPAHPLAAHVEVSMDEEEGEEEEEELYEIDLVLPGDTEPTAFYTSDVDNGVIYEIDDDEAPGEEVGRLENGIPKWATE